QDILMNPIFPTDELELVRKQFKTGLEFELSDPGAMARRHMRTLIYGDHPYSKQTTLESVEAITQQDVVEFHARNYVPNNVLFGVVGDVKWKDVRKKLGNAFAGWQRGTPDRIEYTRAPEAGPTEIYIYHRPTAVQTEIHIGHLGLKPTNPDWPALTVGTRILGVGSDSRLYQNIRETKGWTYRVRSFYAKEKDVGFFTVFSPVRTEVTDSTLTELMSELNRITTEPVTAEELEHAKSYLIGNFPLTIETPDQIVAQVGENKLFGIEKDALETYRERVAAVTIDDVSRVMKKYLHADNAYIVLVGDATEIQDKVAGVANVNLFDIAGEPLSLSSLAVEPVDYQYDTAGLKSMKATYSLTAQQMNIGDLNVTMEKEQDIMRVSSSIVGMISMEETIAFRLADLSPISLKRTMQMGPQTMGADLTFTDAGCTGTVQTMGSTEPKEVTFALVDGTILDSTLEYAITCLPLDVNKEYRFPVVDSQSGSMQTVSVVVMELLDIETPAGSFSTYKVKIMRPDGEAYYYFGKESPHILVKQEVPSQGLTIVLKTFAN
ncbi:MAG: pitrilysin family protein, partial [bacterium]|nr:pitrilysin family protein [bacterium]